MPWLGGSSVVEDRDGADGGSGSVANEQGQAEVQEALSDHLVQVRQAFCVDDAVFAAHVVTGEVGVVGVVDGDVVHTDVDDTLLGQPQCGVAVEPGVLFGVGQVGVGGVAIAGVENETTKGKLFLH